MPYPLLFTPGKIGNLKLKNRLVMPPMVRNYADENGLVTQRYVDHIESIAKGGVGMLVLEASFIRQDGRGFKNELGIQSDKTIAGLKRLARVAHKHKAAIGIQLYHAGRQTNSQTTGIRCVAPSPIADPIKQEVPHQLTTKEIEALVKAYGAAARRAKKAGLDFVEIHGAHGYLITQFLSPFTNKRKDRYGGSAENRFRFLAEVFAAVRKAVGKDFPVTVRLSGDELVAGGLRLKDTVLISKKLEALGVDALHISAGNYASYVQGMMIPPMAIPDAPLAHLAKGVKQAVKIPVIAVAKIRTPELAEKLLKNKTADFIAIGRSLLADPEWPKKAKAGMAKDINSCIACNQGCISRLFADQDVWCTVNPVCGREKRFLAKRKGKIKKVLIAGGGPAGMQAAITAAKRGHKVTIFEKSARLGGQLFAASAAPYRKDWDLLRQSLVKRIADLGVKVRLKTELTPDIARKEKPDAVIVSSGSTPSWPEIPILAGVDVMTARDVMEGKSNAKGKVIMAGGGCAGAQTAEHLAKKGHKVTIVEAKGEIAAEAPVDERMLLLGRLAKAKVDTLINTKIKHIGNRSVIVETSKGENTIKADSVVLCFGSHSENNLALSLKSLVPQVILVGDALKARRVTDAVLEGSLAALSL
ncbi:FAD-dependent oxidoreductase [Candidatus Uhrbacteria bacterium]|nr:FAD-dependent oxidoreductase [Candidatus Uhrbacteria bacterium]